MYLDATNKSISVVLGEARGAADCDITVSYEDLTPTTFVSGAADLVSNGTTPVVIVAAPAAATQRRVREFNLYNNDNIFHTVTVYYVDGASQRVIWSGVLGPSKILNYNSGVWNNGVTGTTGLTGATGVTGGTGSIGASGAAGAIIVLGGILSGTGVPGSGLGVDGDVYIDLSTDIVYKKITGAWVLQNDITGATGASGGTGGVGATGPLGIDWLGAYSAITAYDVTDAILFTDGSAYICISTTVAGEDPVGTPAKWSMIASVGATGAGGVPGASGGTGGVGGTGTAGASGAAGASGVAGGTGGT